MALSSDRAQCARSGFATYLRSLVIELDAAALGGPYGAAGAERRLPRDMARG